MIWLGYDPAAARHALKEAAGILAGVDAAALKKEIRGEQRAEKPRPSRRLMAYLVDSDWLIDYLAGAPDALQLLERLSDAGLAISVITYMEAYQGRAAKLSTPTTPLRDSTPCS